MTAPARAVTPLVRLAPAKLNLTLAVVGRRPDGFHDLHSVMAPLDLADRLAVSPAFGPEDRIHVVGPDGTTAPDVGPAADNLVLRALRAVREAVRRAGDDRPVPALAVRLEKRIPVAAGLGGGSSDAMAALDAALEAWGAADVLGDATRAALAASIGSDCPFFLADGWALVEGRGERVTPLPAPRGAPPGVVLVTPALPVATPAVFGRYAAGARPAGQATLASSNHLAAELRQGLSAGRLLERAGILAVANDLVPATGDLHPELVAARRAIARLLERPVGQSGSGPTMWALSPSKADAMGDAAIIRAALADGLLRLPGDGAPVVVGTEIVPGGTARREAGRASAPAPDPSPSSAPPTPR